MAFHRPLLALLLLVAGFALPQVLPRPDAVAPSPYARQALAEAGAALSGPLERVAVRRLEVVRVVRLGRDCPYRADLVARTWFGAPYASVTVDCTGTTVSRD